MATQLHRIDLRGEAFEFRLGSIRDGYTLILEDESSDMILSVELHDDVDMWKQAGLQLMRVATQLIDSGGGF
jgi:hypothetical protein